jgi:hypothetical protein
MKSSLDFGIEERVGSPTQSRRPGLGRLPSGNQDAHHAAEQIMHSSGRTILVASRPCEETLTAVL